MKDLGIRPILFYYYKAKIYKASEAVQAKKSEQTLAFEQQILKDSSSGTAAVISPPYASPHSHSIKSIKITISMNIMKDL